MRVALSSSYATAFITGVSSGIGAEFAQMLLNEGVRVWGTSRDINKLQHFTSKYPELFTPVALDLANPEDAQSALERAASSIAQNANESHLSACFDLVINNAGYGVFAEFSDADFSTWNRQIDALLTTTIRLAHVAIRPMFARNRGCLVNVSSLAAEFPLPYMSGYNVSKAGLSALSQSLGFETRRTDVKVIDFRPGDYCTDFNNIMRPASEMCARAADAEREARKSRSWKTIDAQFSAAPHPRRAAEDLRRALVRKKSGIVRSGTFFQATLAPLAARLLPAPVMRALAVRYFGLT